LNLEFLHAKKAIEKSAPLEIKPGLLNAIIAESTIPKSEFIKDLQAL